MLTSNSNLLVRFSKKRLIEIDRILDPGKKPDLNNGINSSLRKNDGKNTHPK